MDEEKIVLTEMQTSDSFEDETDEEDTDEDENEHAEMLTSDNNLGPSNMATEQQRKSSAKRLKNNFLKIIPHLEEMEPDLMHEYEDTNNSKVARYLAANLDASLFDHDSSAFKRYNMIKYHIAKENFMKKFVSPNEKVIDMICI